MKTDYEPLVRAKASNDRANELLAKMTAKRAEADRLLDEAAALDVEIKECLRAARASLDEYEGQKGLE